MIATFDELVKPMQDDRRWRRRVWRVRATMRLGRMSRGLLAGLASAGGVLGAGPVSPTQSVVGAPR